MKIGIDVDGVLLDYEKGMIANAEIYDIEECRGRGIIHPNKYFVQDKYDWTYEEKEKFIKENLGKVSKDSNIMAGAKYVVKKLRKMENELIIISSRGTESDEMIDIVTEKFDKEGIKFDKYYWKKRDKLDICCSEKIDIMIDDSPIICQKMAENKIKTIYFRGIRGNDLEKSEYIKEVNNWGEVYRYILKQNSN